MHLVIQVIEHHRDYYLIILACVKDSTFFAVSGLIACHGFPPSKRNQLLNCFFHTRIANHFLTH